MSDFKLFAVTGHPILHSRSPQIHNVAFKAVGMEAAYVRLAAESAQEAIEAAVVFGLSGINVTAPFKEEFFRLVAKRDGNVEATGAVNTVLFGKEMAGFNTDVEGVTGSFAEAGVKVAGAKAVVIGGGGAAMAAAYALTKNGAKVTIANRTREKAERIAGKFGASACSLDESELAEALDGATIIVSTAATAERIVPAKLLKKGMAVLDAYYAHGETALMKDAAKAGCKVLDADSWLLQQGYAAFEILSGKKAPQDAMRKAVAGGKIHTPANIGLVGMMGSGKSSVAAALAAKNGREMIDVDAEIVKKGGRSIASIFAEDGEAAFRKMEEEAVAAAVKRKNCVISFGGGAVLSEKNRKAIAAGCTVVWLQASVKQMAQRAAASKDRPLLAGKDAEKEIAKLLEARMKFYAETCDLAVSTDKKSAERVAELIAFEMRL